VVCRNWEDDRVLPRFARYLSRINGWGLSKVVDPTCDLNYYMAYFEILKNKQYTGEVAAYFTHYEHNGKGEWYDKVAAKTVLNIAMNKGQLRHLRTFGKSITIPLPVEQDHFTLKQKNYRPGQKPVVGFSGFIYASGRKGEELAKSLVQEYGTKIVFSASGKGWPCSTQRYNWVDLPTFFKQLDIFVCTSELEGGPMTTLEALSTGLPVVIPAEVGIHPELPYIPGIYRYVTGNRESLAVALEQAISELRSIDRESLRASIAKYTVGEFCYGHRKAFEEILLPEPEPEIEVKQEEAGKTKIESGKWNEMVKEIGGKTESISQIPPPDDWKKRSGIYIVAFGDPARKCANRCIRACKRQMPDIPVALCAVSPMNVGEDIFIQEEDLDIGGRTAKLAAYEKAPQDWEYILYLDADTEPVENLYFIFNILRQGWELVICKDMAKYSLARFMARGDNKPETIATLGLIGTDEVLQYNGGVFGFRRSPRVQRFFRLWQDEWQKWAARDQGALLRAIYTHPMKLFVLMNQWNASDRYPAPDGEVAVWHHNIEARRWAGKIGDRLDSEKAWSVVKQWQKLNKTASPKDTL